MSIKLHYFRINGMLRLTKINFARSKDKDGGREGDLNTVLSTACYGPQSINVN